MADYKVNNVNPKSSKKIRHTLLALAIAQASMAPAVQAATIVVTSQGDAGSGCTLREAIQSSNQTTVALTGCVNIGPPFGLSAPDVITFESGINTVTLSEGALDINHSMEIVANGVTIQKELTLDDRLMTIDGAFNVTLVGLTLIGGGVTGAPRGAVINVNTAIFSMRDSVITGGSGQSGGGLFIENGAVATLRNTTVTANHATSLNGGGIHVTGGSTLTLFDSIISNNSAKNAGGGIALDYSSTAIINTSTISGNSATAGGGINSQRDINLTLNQSVIMENSAEAEGGGVRAIAGSQVVVANSTISNNNANNRGGGVYSRVAGTSVSVVNSTISNNSANDGGNLYAAAFVNFSLTNSIVANSQISDDCGGYDSFTANRQNIIEDGSCNTAALNVDPALGPLADNGGATLSHALLANSPAISAGSNAVCTASPVNSIDQRGEPRANPDGTICDLGAFESPEGRPESTFFVVPVKNGNAVIFSL